MIRIKRLFKSFQYAFKGLIKVFREEQNLRAQSLIGLFVAIFAWYFNLGRVEWALLIFAACLVLLMEIANSAIERVSDILKPKIDAYVKEIKDIMAAAVMLASLAAAIIGIIIFWPYVIGL